MEFMDKIKDYLASPAVTVIVGAIVAFIIIRFIYRKIFKKNSVRLVISVITVCIIIFLIVLNILKYFEGAGQVYLSDDMNYVYGKVVYVDPVGLDIKINSVRTNLKNGGSGEITGEMTALVKVAYNNKAVDEKITLKDIKTGDYVYLITTSEEAVKGKVPVKLILKQSKSSIFSILFNERTN